MNQAVGWLAGWLREVREKREEKKNRRRQPNCADGSRVPSAPPQPTRRVRTATLLTVIHPRTANRLLSGHAGTGVLANHQPTRTQAASAGTRHHTINQNQSCQTGEEGKRLAVFGLASRQVGIPGRPLTLTLFLLWPGLLAALPSFRSDVVGVSATKPGHPKMLNRLSDTHASSTPRSLASSFFSTELPKEWMGCCADPWRLQRPAGQPPSSCSPLSQPPEPPRSGPPGTAANRTAAPTPDRLFFFPALGGCADAQ